MYTLVGGDLSCHIKLRHCSFVSQEGIRRRVFIKGRTVAFKIRNYTVCEKLFHKIITVDPFLRGHQTVKIAGCLFGQVFYFVVGTFFSIERSHKSNRVRKVLLHRVWCILEQSVKFCYICAKRLVKDMAGIKTFNIPLLLFVEYEDAVPFVFYRDAVELHYRAVYREAYITDMKYIADL